MFGEMVRLTFAERARKMKEYEIDYRFPPYHPRRILINHRGRTPMTNDELQEHIRAIEEALKAGELQEKLYRNSDWQEPSSGTVEVGDGVKYRIKPKPREWWLHIDRNMVSYVASESHTCMEGIECIRVREIVDE